MSAEQETVTEETLAPDLDELLRDLEEEFGVQAQTPQVDEWLVALQLGDSMTRVQAAEALGALDASSEEIVAALLAARVADSDEEVKRAAADALQAPAHLEILRQNQGLRWKLAVEAMEADRRPAHSPEFSDPGSVLYGTSQDVWLEIGVSALGGLGSTLVWLGLILWFALSGRWWFSVAILGGVLYVAGRPLYDEYLRRKCPECHRPLAGEIVQSRRTHHGEVSDFLLNSRGWRKHIHYLVHIYECRYCKKRWSGTRQVIKRERDF